MQLKRELTQDWTNHILIKMLPMEFLPESTRLWAIGAQAETAASNARIGYSLNASDYSNGFIKYRR